MQRHKKEQIQNRQIHICRPYVIKIFLQNTGASKWLSGLEILISSYFSLTPVKKEQRLEPVSVAGFTTHTHCGSDQIFPAGFSTVP